MKKIKKIIVSVFVLAILVCVSILFASNSFARGRASMYTIGGDEYDAGSESISGTYDQLMSTLNSDGDAHSFLRRETFQYRGTACGMNDEIAFIAHTSSGNGYQAYTYVTWFKVDFNPNARQSDGLRFFSTTITPIKSQEYFYEHLIGSNTYTLKLYNNNYNNKKLCMSGMYTKTSVSNAGITSDDAYAHGFTMAPKMNLWDVFASENTLTLLKIAIGRGLDAYFPGASTVWSAAMDIIDGVEAGYNILEDTIKVIAPDIRGDEVDINDPYHHNYLATNSTFFAIRPVKEGDKAICINKASDFMNINTYFQNITGPVGYDVNVGLSFYDDFNGKEVSCYHKYSKEAYKDIETNASFNIQGKEINYFKFVPSSSGNLALYTESSLDTYMYLYDQKLDEIDHDDDSGSGRNALISNYFDKDKTYYIGVRGYYDSTNGSCKLIISSGTTDISVSNLSTNSLSASYNQSVMYVGNEIPVSYTNSFGSTVSIYTQGDIDTAFNNIVIKDVNGNDVTSQRGLSYDDDYEPDDPAEDGDEDASIYVSLETGDTISFNVYCYNGVGQFDFYLYVSYNSIYDGSSRTFQINGKNENKYMFVPSTSGTKTFYTSSSLDTYMYLYDANGYEITHNDDGGENLNSKITYSFTAGQRYIISVRGYSVNTKGSCTLSCMGSIDGTYKGELYIGTTNQAFSYSSGAVYYKYTCDVTGRVYLSSTDGINHAYVYLYNSNMSLLTSNKDGVNYYMTKGTVYYVKFVPTALRDGCSYQVNCSMYNSVSANRISIVGNARIGDALPSDYTSTYNFTFTTSRTKYYRVVTDGSLDTVVYVYINGILKYIEDDQEPYDEEDSGDINAFFSEQISAGNTVTVVVAAFGSGSTNVSFS